MSTIHYGSTCGAGWGGHKTMAPKMHWAVEGDIPFWTKESRGEGLGSQNESRQFTGRQERANLW